MHNNKKKILVEKEIMNFKYEVWYQIAIVMKLN